MAPQLDLTHARRTFTRPLLYPNTFRKYTKQILRGLCMAQGIPCDHLSKESKKDDYVDAIHAAHRDHHKIAVGALNPRRATPRHSKDDGHGPDALVCPHPPDGVQHQPSGSEPADPSEAARTFVVRQFDKPRDWNPVHEVDYYTATGDVSLVDLHRLLRCPSDHKIQIIDTKFYKPFYEYQPGVVLRADVEDLEERGCLRVVDLAQGTGGMSRVEPVGRSVLIQVIGMPILLLTAIFVVT